MSLTMGRLRAAAILLWACTAWIGCSRERPPSPPSLSDERFIEFSAQSAVLSREAKLAGQDSLTIHRRIDSLEQAMQVTEAQIEESMAYYRHDLRRWESVAARVVKRLEEMQTKK